MRSFTLLEVMIALVLLAMAAGITGIRLHRGLEEKQFQTAADRLHAELEACRRQSLNMQTDWIAVLKKSGDRFVLTRVCPETKQSQRQEWPAPCQLNWNGQPADEIQFLFSATGKIAPAGIFALTGPRKRSIEWKIPQLFAYSEETDGSLPRPESLLKPKSARDNMYTESE